LRFRPGQWAKAFALADLAFAVPADDVMPGIVLSQ
jgi:hypothetical protein